MRIVQVVAALNCGDAVGNDAMAIMEILTELGYDTAIYSDYIDPRIRSNRVFLRGKLRNLTPKDVLLYHFATGTNLNHYITRYRCKKIMRYHNITPPNFFDPYDHNVANIVEEGRAQLKSLSRAFDYCLPVSAFNRQELVDYGFQCPMDVLPIVIPFGDYNKEAATDLIEKYKKDNTVNILSVGRIAPNKCFEDVIAAFERYQTLYNPNCRLHIVGSVSTEKYYDRLRIYTRELDLNSVNFTGHISFSKILAYYRLSDIYVCMSEHEGFCVPLVEAMYFQLPILAYDEAAVPNTLGGSGILLPKPKDPLFAAGFIDRLIRDQQLRQKIIQGQTSRLEYFSYESIRQTFLQLLFRFLQ